MPNALKRGGSSGSLGRLFISVSACLLTLSFAGTASAQWRHAAAGAAAAVVKPQILRTVSHDPSAFTQGLICVDTVLYESTGIEGKSTLRRVSAGSGKVLQTIPRRGNEFAEGIAILGGELVQLTWKNGVAIRYEYPSLKESSTYKYKGEGWGLTNDAAQFIMSNGTDTLYFRDKKFEVTRKAPVTLNGKPLIHLNELEYARGHVYANVWYKNFIVEISPASGVVNRVIDCSEIVGIERPASVDHVLNGIAYHEGADEWYLTGKNWGSVFVVKIPR
jgi:glutamine cyclotransferase